MQEITIQKNEAGQRLDKFLKKLLREAPSSFLYKMLRKKNIVLNGKKAAGNEILACGDQVRIFFSDETFQKFVGNIQKEGIAPSGVFLNIIYEDADLLIIDKPAGMLSQKADREELSANEYILQYLLDSGAVTRESLASFRPSVCNRLDRNTSGLLIAGKTLAGAQRISRALKERSIQKYYLCLVRGRIESPGRIEGYLTKDEEQNEVHISRDPKKDGKPIATEYEPLEYHGGYTLLRVHLITGRSHQIRAHLASIGHPIVGDVKYGEKKINRKFAEHAGVNAQLLHAYQLILEDGQTITAGLPECFMRAFDYLDSP